MAALELDGAVTLNNLHKAYGDRVVVNDVSLEVRSGEFFRCSDRLAVARQQHCE